MFAGGDMGSRGVVGAGACAGELDPRGGAKSALYLKKISSLSVGPAGNGSDNDAGSRPNVTAALNFSESEWSLPMWRRSGDFCMKRTVQMRHS